MSDRRSEQTETYDFLDQITVQAAGISQSQLQMASVENWNKPVETGSTGEEIITYVISKLYQYEEMRRIDDNLFYDFQEDFEGWTTQMFQAIDPMIRRTMKTFFRTRGVYTGADSLKTYVAFSRLVGLEAPLEWLDREAYVTDFVEKSVCRIRYPFGTVISREPTRSTAPRSTIPIEQAQPARPEEWSPQEERTPHPQQERISQDRKAHTPYPYPGEHHHPYDPDTSRAPPREQEPENKIEGRTQIRDMVIRNRGSEGIRYNPYYTLPPREVKIEPLTEHQLSAFNKNFQKTSLYSGDPYDPFDAKVREFLRLCETLGIQLSQMHVVFPYMLTDEATTFYRESVDTTDSFATAYKRVRDYFHGQQNLAQYYLDWSSLTFDSVKQANPGKSGEEILNTLIKKLKSCQTALGENYRHDTFLRDTVTRACRGVPQLAWGIVMNRPDMTSQAYIENLRYAARTYEEDKRRNQAAYITVPNGEDAEINYTDRRYIKNRRQYPPRAHSDGYRGNRSYRKPRARSSPYTGNKVCFICKKQGCWSTNHPHEERVKQYKAYLSSDNAIYYGGTPEQYQAFLDTQEGVENDPDDEVRSREDDDVDSEEGSVRQFLNDHIVPQYLLEDRYSSDRFQGILPDTGAAHISTVGMEQYKALRSQYPEILPMDILRAGEASIQFGKGSKASSLGTVKVPTAAGEITFHVLDTRTPFLLCLKDMDELKLTLDNVNNVLIQRLPDGRTKAIPITRRWGHPWFFIDAEPIQTQNDAFLTDTELRRLHRRFGHPATERLNRLLVAAGEPGYERALEAIERVCHHCQIHMRKPSRFRFTLKDDLDPRFNYEVLVDIVYLNADGEKPVLHIVDTGTSFQGGRFLPSSSAKDVWETLRMAWIDTYQGPPDTVTHDAGTAFTAIEFQNAANSLNIECRQVPVEAHQSIGKVERYHAPLRRAFEILYAELSATTSREAILQMAFKAINDTVGPGGLVPTLLVFGEYPRISSKAPPSPAIRQRAEAISKAMRALRAMRAKRQIRDAINTRNGPSSTEVTSLPLQSEVLVWRENRGWQGPYKILAIDNQDVTLDMPNGPTNFRSTALQPYHRDPETIVVHERTDDEANEIDELPAPIDEPPAPINEQPQTARRGRPRGSRNRQRAAGAYLTKKEADDYALSLQLRKEGKITTAGPPFEASSKLEIDSLIGRGVFALERFDEARHGRLRIFNMRFVNEIKDKLTQPYEKTRMVLAGHHDTGKQSVLTRSPTIQRCSQRLILAIAVNLRKAGYQIALRDITQAYVQSTTTLNRPILARLPDKIHDQYPPDTIIRVIKPLYGIAEAGVHWFITYLNHHITRLRMTTSTYDQCLLISNPPHETNGAMGIAGLQTDDTLILGNQKFLEDEEAQLREAGFTAKPRRTLMEGQTLEFNGGRLSLDNDTLSYRQKNQASKLKIIDPKSENRDLQYVEQRARGAYIASICQPDASFDLAIAAQAQQPDDDDIARLNKRIQWQIENAERGLSYIDIDLPTAKLMIFADGSHAGNKNLSSQIGYVIVLANEIRNDETFTIRANMIHWTSVRCKRVVSSSLAAELFGIAAAVDIGISISTTLTRITDRLGLPQIPLVLCTDSQSIYDTIGGLNTTKEKRLMIQLMALRESYENREIHEVRWIPGKENPADALTKESSKANGSLRQLVAKNELSITLQGYVTRPEKRRTEPGKPTTAPEIATEGRQRSAEHTSRRPQPASEGKQRSD